MAINSRQQQKRDYEYNWMLAAGSFFPLRGEIIVYEAEAIKNSDGTITPINGAMIPIDRNFRYTYPRFKVGDGVHAVDQLPFVGAQVQICTWEDTD